MRPWVQIQLSVHKLGWLHAPVTLALGVEHRGWKPGASQSDCPIGHLHIQLSFCDYIIWLMTQLYLYFHIWALELLQMYHQRVTTAPWVQELEHGKADSAGDTCVALCCLPAAPLHSKEMILFPGGDGTMMLSMYFQELNALSFFFLNLKLKRWLRD